jgi:hypothetical protein
MTKPLRLLFLTAVVAAVALGAGAARALACGNSNGYSYAHIAASSNAFGISAQIAQTSVFDIFNGHVAGWVGIGGTGEGPHGSNEWLRVGSSALPGITGSDIYYEVALPRRFAIYHEVSTGVAIGTYTRVTVLEMRNRPNRWRVWVNHKPVSPPIRLPESHNGLMATATSESWDGGTGGQCNDFSYSFRHISIARAMGGDWQQLTDGYPIQSTVPPIQHTRGA